MSYTTAESSATPRWRLFVTVSIYLLYLVAFSVTPKTVFWSPDEGAKFVQLHTACWTNEAGRSLPYPGQRLDPTYNFYPQSPLYPQPRAGGQVQCHWPVWFPLLSRLPFKLLGPTGLYLVPLLSGLLVIRLVGSLAHRLLPGNGPLAMLMVGLAGPIFFYSLLFWEHTLVTLLGLVALWQLTRLDRARWLPLPVAGLALVAATAMRLEMAAYGLALAIAVGFSWLVHSHRLLLKRWPWTVAGIGGLLLTAGAGFGLLKAVPWLIPARHWQMMHKVTAINEYSLWTNLPIYLRESWFSNPIQELVPVLTWLGLVGLLLGGLAALWLLFPRAIGWYWLLLAAAILSWPVSFYVLMWPQPYRVIHSLFLPAPYLIFAFLAIPYARQRRCFPATLVVSTTFFYLAVGTLAVIVRGGAGAAGLEWSTRYMLTFYPLGGICAALGLHYVYRRLQARWCRYLLVSLAALSIFVAIQYQVRGIQEIQKTKNVLSTYAYLVQQSDGPIVTDIWWLPAALAPRFVEQEMYMLARPEALPQWLDLAGQQIDQFVLVSLNPPDEALIKSISHSLELREQKTVFDMSFSCFERVKGTISSEEY